MIPVDEARLTDVKAMIAVGAADRVDRRDRISIVCGLLQCDPDEARDLIARGRRIAREKAEGKVA